MLFDVMVALMFIGVIALLLVGLAVIVVKKLRRIHKEEGGKPAATAKRMGVFALGGLAALAGAVANFLGGALNNAPEAISETLDEMIDERLMFGWWGGEEC